MGLFFKKPRNDDKYYAQHKAMIAAASTAYEELIRGLEELILASSGTLEELESDSPEIRQKKRLLQRCRTSIAQWKNLSPKPEKKNVLEKETKRLLKETEAIIKQFMDFDHTRDRDGRLDSLGETAGNRSTFEKPLAKLAAALAISKVTQGLWGRFTGKLQEHFSGLQEIIQERVVQNGINSIAMQTGLQPELISQAFVELEALEAQFGASKSTPQQRPSPSNDPSKGGASPENEPLQTQGQRVQKWQNMLRPDKTPGMDSDGGPEHER